MGAGLLIAVPCQAADVGVTINQVRNDRGHVLLALCARADFLKPHCAYQARTAAMPGAVHLVLHGVPPGRYAAQAFHDENDNLVLDRGFLGMPLEGLGFSNDARMRFGPPGFDAAAVVVGARGVELAFGLKYY